MEGNKKMLVQKDNNNLTKDNKFNIKICGNGGKDKGESTSIGKKDSKSKLIKENNVINNASNANNNIPPSLINKQQSISKLNLQNKYPLTLQSIQSNNTNDTYLLPPIH